MTTTTTTTTTTTSSTIQLKKVLSANSEAPINVECLIDDIDFQSSMTRDKFEELAASLVERTKQPLSQVKMGFEKRITCGVSWDVTPKPTSTSSGNGVVWHQIGQD